MAWFCRLLYNYKVGTNYFLRLSLSATSPPPGRLALCSTQAPKTKSSRAPKWHFKEITQFLRNKARSGSIVVGAIKTLIVVTKSLN